ncbi:hypothetical protein [Microbacterium sp. NC79]|uniref:hypothetical protein n=1 Tax=Microbacterium sp. NC79 TaxID=2851009 RepID=UPI001C2CA02A|nr:hypothetical protein [Microbacterium sp. NC79]MBV0893892.1 hypothetical protein [Microbacterium sp. NC79]
MIRFINEYRDRFGVELICRVLRPAVQGFLTSRGYRSAVGRAAIVAVATVAASVGATTATAVFPSYA